MKNIVFLLLVCFAYLSCSDDDSIEAEKTYTVLPDENFEKILVEQGFDSDETVNGVMLYTDSKKIIKLKLDFTNLRYDNNEISLIGINDFINLKSLNIEGGETNTIDLSLNKQLVNLKLDRIEIKNRFIINENSNLKNLHLEFINITYLNLYNNTELDSLIVYSSKLEALKISTNQKLKFLDLESYSDDFTDLDISNNINLKSIKLRTKKISSLDISKLTKLKNLDIIDNPKLVCTKIYDNQDISNYKYGYHTVFTTNCTNLPEREYITITNEDFERILIGQNIDTEDELDGKVLKKSLENAKSIFIGGRAYIQPDSLDGLETLVNLEKIFFPDLLKLKLEEYDFSQNSKLKYFGVRNSQIEQNIDLSQLKNLETLYLEGENYGSIDFSQCLELKKIEFYDVNTGDYDLSKNTKLETLRVDNVNSIDISQCLNLKHLTLGSSVLQSIDLLNNTNLIDLYLSTPSITSLNLNNNLNLESLELAGLSINSLQVNDKTNLSTLSLSNLNSLIQLDVKNNASLESFSLNNCPLITNIDVNQNTNLEFLKIENSQQIANIDLGNNINLKYLKIADTQINNLNIENNTLLKRFIVINTPLQSLDISNHINLTTLVIDNTNIESLDIQNKRLLKNLAVQNSSFTNLDLKNQTNLIQLFVDNNQLNSLDISNNLLLEYIQAFNNPNLNCIKIAKGQKIINGYNYLDSQQFFNVNCN